MSEYNGLPPEENPAPASGVYPPPEEGAVGASAADTGERGHHKKALRRSGKSALLLAAAGILLCSVIYSAPMKPAAAVEPPAETTQPGPAEEESAAVSKAERLVAVGTWKNSAESEWVRFNADGTGWWYDGRYFGRMVWKENADGGITYEAGMAYLGPGLKMNDEYIPEKEGDCLHSAHERGGIELLAEEDRFVCPGLLFGEGAYLPDDTVIDASAMDGVCRKTAAELVSGSSWHMAEISDLGIPVAPSAEGGKPELYTDTVFVQSIDFAAGTFRLAAKNGGLLWREDWTALGDSIYEDAAVTLDVPFSIADRQELTKAAVDIDVDITYGFFSDLHPGDTEYNNMHFLWGRSISSEPTDVYILITSSGVSLGIEGVDLYFDNYTLLARDGELSVR